MMTRDRRQLLRKLGTFGVIGAAGFVVDAGVLTLAMRWLESGLYVSRIYSFLVAVTFTWAMNRRFTFRSRNTALVGEWLHFVIANGVGGLINLGTYTVLVASLPLFAMHPILAVAAGSIVALAWNFTLSSRWVFRGQ